jgi:AcrR family transcriptional regulator
VRFASPATIALVKARDTVPTGARRSQPNGDALSTARKTSYHHGDLKAALEQAALELVLEKGPQSFTLAEASRRAGVSNAAPYKHYADRESLLAALAIRGYHEGDRRVIGVLRLEIGPLARMERFASEYVRFAAEERALFNIVHHAGLDRSKYPEMLEAGQAGYMELVELTRDVRPDEADAASVLNSVMVIAHGVAIFLLDSYAEPTPEQTGRSMLEATRLARLVVNHQDWGSPPPFIV